MMIELRGIFTVGDKVEVIGVDKSVHTGTVFYMHKPHGRFVVRLDDNNISGKILPSSVSRINTAELYMEFDLQTRKSSCGCRVQESPENCKIMKDIGDYIQSYMRGKNDD